MLQLRSLNSKLLESALELLLSEGLEEGVMSHSFHPGSLTILHRAIPVITELFPHHLVNGLLRPVSVMPSVIRSEGLYNTLDLSELISVIYADLRESRMGWVSFNMREPRWGGLRLVMHTDSGTPCVTLTLERAHDISLPDQADLFNRFVRTLGLAGRIRFVSEDEKLVAVPTDDRVRPAEEFKKDNCDPGEVYFSVGRGLFSGSREVMLRLCGADVGFLQTPLTGIADWAGPEAEAVALSVHHWFDPFEETRRALNALSPRDWYVDASIGSSHYGVTDLHRLLAETIRFRLPIGRFVLSDERGACELEVAVSGEEGAFTVWVATDQICDYDLIDEMFDFGSLLAEQARKITDDITRLSNP